MNNQKGFAPLIAILVLVLVGGGAYAIVNRSALKSYFQAGDKPAESNSGGPKDKFEDGDIPAGEDKKSGDKPTAGQFNNSIESRLAVGATTGKEEGSKNVSPEDKKKFTIEEAMKPIMFRWTPLVPKPKEPVTYKLRVWQLMQGQNGTQAMKENKPIVEKDVVGATEVSVSGIYTGPCKPPYLCDFVWQAGANAATTFSVTDEKSPKELTGASLRTQ